MVGRQAALRQLRMGLPPLMCPLATIYTSKAVTWLLVVSFSWQKAHAKRAHTPAVVHASCTSITIAHCLYPGDGSSWLQATQRITIITRIRWSVAFLDCPYHLVTLFRKAGLLVACLPALGTQLDIAAVRGCEQPGNL